MKYKIVFKFNNTLWCVWNKKMNTQTWPKNILTTINGYTKHKNTCACVKCSHLGIKTVSTYRAPVNDVDMANTIEQKSHVDGQNDAKPAKLGGM